MAPFNSRHEYDEGTFVNMMGNLGMDANYSPPGIDSDLNNCGDYDVYKKVCSSVLFRMKFNTSRCSAPGIELSDIRFYDYMYNEVYPVFMNAVDEKPMDANHTYKNLMLPRVVYSEYVTGDGSSMDLPLCGAYHESYNKCMWTDAEKTECAAALCRAQGYVGGVYVSDSNHMCDDHHDDEKGYTYHLSSSVRWPGEINDNTSRRQTYLTEVT
eukprot:UN32930